VFLRNFLQPPVTFSLLGADILSIFFTETLSRYSSLNVRDQVFRTTQSSSITVDLLLLIVTHFARVIKLFYVTFSFRVWSCMCLRLPRLICLECWFIIIIYLFKLQMGFYTVAVVLQ
jgi:hypothetical protein